MATESEILTKLNDLLSTYGAVLSVSGGSKLLTLDRAGSGDTAAVVIKQGTGERWRLGQFGADAFALQRSPSGAAVDYTDVLSINRATGRVDITGDGAISGNLYVGGIVRIDIAATGGGPAAVIGAAGDKVYIAPTDLVGGSNWSRELVFDAAGDGVWTAEGGFRTTGTLIGESNLQVGFAALLSTYPGIDLEDTDAGYTTHNRLRFHRSGNAFQMLTLPAGGGAAVSTDLTTNVTAGGIASWSFRLLGTEKLRLDAAGLAAIGVYDATTANAANVNVASNGRLARSTSSLQYKTDVEPADREMLRDTLLAIEPIWYRSLCASDDADLSWWGIGAEDLAELDPRFVAWRTVEEVQETYTERWPVFGTDPETGKATTVWHEEERTRPVLVPLPREEWTAEGVAYERLTVALISVVQDQQAAIAGLEAELAVLETGFAALEARLAVLEAA